MTEKDLPSDVDVAICIESIVAEKFTDSQLSFIDEINTTTYISQVEALAFVSYPVGHPLYGANEDERWTYSELYGIENAGYWLKGRAVLRLRETNVGLRINR